MLIKNGLLALCALAVTAGISLHSVLDTAETTRRFGPENPVSESYSDARPPKIARGEIAPLRQDPMPVLAFQTASISRAKAAVRTQRIDTPRERGLSVEPVLASYRRDGADHVALAWHQVDFESARDRLQLGASVSHDGGLQWERRIYDGIGTLGENKFDPFAAADSVSGKLWVGALARAASARPGASGIFLAEAGLTGGFSEARVIDTEADDKVAATFGRSGAQSELLIASTRFFRSSSDLGLSFTRQPNSAAGNLGLSSIGFFPVLMPDQELLNVAYGSILPSIDEPETSSQLILTRRAPGNAAPAIAERVRQLNFSSLQTLDAAVPGKFRMPPFGQLARNSRGQLFYVYNDVVSTIGSERNVEVLLIQSDDRGRSWSQPRVVHGDSSTPRDQFMPALAIGPDDVLHVLFFDTRRSADLDAAEQVSLDVVYARSSDGVRFDEQFLTTAPFDASRMAWRPFNSDATPFIGDYLAITATEAAVYAAYPEFVGNQTALRLATLSNSFAIGPGITGAWYDPRQSGHGLFLEVLPENRFLAWWFTFDRAGNQSWFGGVGTFTGNVATIDDVRITQGGRFIPDFNPALVRNQPWGKMRFEFDNCSSGRVSFQAIDSSYGQGSMALTRLTLPAGLRCE